MFENFRPVYDSRDEISPETRALVALLDQHRRMGIVDEYGLIEQFRRQTIDAARKPRLVVDNAAGRET